MQDLLYKATNLPLPYWILFTIVIVVLSVMGNKLLKVNNIMSVFFSFLIVFFLAFLVIVLREPSPNIIYQGYIYDDKTNKGIENVTITLLDYPDMIGKTLKTNDKGFFKFSNIPRERTTNVEFIHSDYTTENKSVSISRTNKVFDKIFLKKEPLKTNCLKLEKDIVNTQNKLRNQINIIRDSIKFLEKEKKSTYHFDTLQNRLQYYFDNLTDYNIEITRDSTGCEDFKTTTLFINEVNNTLNNF